MAEAYFTLRTNNDPTKLVGVSTPAARSTELRARSTDGSRRLRTGETTFDPRHPVIFSRRGNHLVIHEPVLRAGDRVPLTFHVEPAPPITVNVEVRAGKPQGLL
jgi:copper(I)-binding protein